ncbi:MAG: damage-control phosphatase ARMT1 family protein [Candidatus Hodarchaeales archaeon]
MRSAKGSVKDPYKELKAQSNALLLQKIPDLRNKLYEGKNPFDRGMRMAVAGNIIDYASVSDFDVFETIDKVLIQEFAIDDSQELFTRLSDAKTLVYLTDNAGEIVLDFIFLEYIVKELNPYIDVTVIVKAEPTINDAMVSDAVEVGMSSLPRLSIETVIPITNEGKDGRDGLAFRKKLENAGVVISKGQGNYEALNNVPGIFFLLLVKCPVLAKDIDVELNSAVCYLSK